MSPGPARSPLHRCPAGVKLGALALAGTAIFAVTDWRWLVGVLTVVAGLYALARVPVGTAFGQIRPALWVLTVLFAAQALLADGATAALVTLRVATLILAAALVTLTTRQADMVATIEAGLRPFQRVGVAPAKVGLALALALRLVPLIADEAAQVRAAQRARGLERGLFALAVPLIVHLLKMAHDLADAIDARGFAGDD